MNWREPVHLGALGTANGRFCWLKDLWELDLTTYQFQNILPVNNASIQYEGALAIIMTNRDFIYLGDTSQQAIMRQTKICPIPIKHLFFIATLIAGL